MGKSNESIDWFNIALGFLKDKNYVDAEHVLKRGTSYGKGTAKMHFLLGLIYFKQRKIVEAELVWDEITDFKSLQLDPFIFHIFITIRFQIQLSSIFPQLQVNQVMDYKLHIQPKNPKKARFKGYVDKLDKGQKEKEMIAIRKRAKLIDMVVNDRMSSYTDKKLAQLILLLISYIIPAILNNLFFPIFYWVWGIGSVIWFFRWEIDLHSKRKEKRIEVLNDIHEQGETKVFSSVELKRI